MESSKQNYYYQIANKLNNNHKNSKSYWSILKLFLKYKNILLIPPLFLENCFIIGFKEKAKLFNSFFSKQCSLILNHAKLPISSSYVTDKCSSAIKFAAKGIGNITRSLDPNKAYNCYK